jgi:proteic killer suppression protein
MIRSFLHRGLKELWTNGTSKHVNDKFHARALRRLDALDSARKLDDMNIPGFDFHRLNGLPIRYSIHVNGPWCITFGWDKTDAVRVNFEQYH